jgi:hypothetical protein
MNWRDNADRLRRLMMDTITKGLKKEMEIFRVDELAQMADAMPEPPAGYELELKVSTPDCTVAATITRSESWWGAAYMDLRGLSPEFAEACLEHLYRGNATPLRDYVKSEKPLNEKERERLARLLPKGSKTGRPRNLQIRGAADLAWRFYRMLLEINKDSGVADRGCSDDMKLYAARAMVSDYCSHIERLSGEEQEHFALQVREFMDKSKARRSGTEEAVISVPAPWLNDRQKS